MDAATAFHAAAAVLLIIAGVVKIVRPSITADVLRDLGAPAFGRLSDTLVVVSLGAVEFVVGVGALAAGGSVFAAATGILYVAFAVSVVRALAVGATSCGCFGRIEAPPSWIHVVGNSALAAASFVAIAASTPLEVMDDQSAGGVGFVILVGVLAGLALVLFTALPEALAARKPRLAASPNGAGEA